MISLIFDNVSRFLGEQSKNVRQDFIKWKEELSQFETICSILVTSDKVLLHLMENTIGGSANSWYYDNVSKYDNYKQVVNVMGVELGIIKGLWDF